MTDPELIAYLLVFATSVVWSGFSVNRKSILFSMLAGMSWWVLAISHLYGYATTAFLSFVWLYFGFGAVFWIYGFALTITSYLSGKESEVFELR